MASKPKKKAAVQPGGPESPPPWRLALAVLLLVGTGFEAWRLVQLKISQHHWLQMLAPIAAQGEAPGQVSVPLAIKVMPDGGLWALSAWKDRCRLQRFSPEFRFEKAWELGPEFRDTRDLALEPDGTVVLALGASLVPLDLGTPAKVSPKARALPPLAKGLGDLRGLDVTSDGNWITYDVVRHALLVLDPKGALVKEKKLSPGYSVRHLAVTASGRVAALAESGAFCQVRVFSPMPDLKLERAFAVVSHRPGAPNRIAACDGETLLLNDAAGAKGIFFFDAASGRLIAESLGTEHDLLIHPGFCAGDPARRVAWVHFGTGLVKVMPPREGM